MNKTEYTLGFLFNPDFTQVALIRKNRPAWQAGKLNGIGGHTEKESALYCMCREFSEEAIYPSAMPNWKHYATMEGKDFVVICFAAVGNTSLIKGKTDEEIVVVPVDSLLTKRKDILDNIPWLVFLAVNYLRDGSPSLTVAKYV